MSVSSTLIAVKNQLIANCTPAPKAVIIGPPSPTTSTVRVITFYVYHKKIGGTDKWIRADMNDTVGHQYEIEVLFILGSAKEDLEKLYAKSDDAPESIMVALFSDITLGGNVAQIGDMKSDDLAIVESAKVIKLGNNDYFFGKLSFSVYEELPLTTR